MSVYKRNHNQVARALSDIFPPTPSDSGAPNGPGGGGQQSQSSSSTKPPTQPSKTTSPPAKPSTTKKPDEEQESSTKEEESSSKSSSSSSSESSSSESSSSSSSIKATSASNTLPLTGTPLNTAGNTLRLVPSTSTEFEQPTLSASSASDGTATGTGAINTGAIIGGIAGGLGGIVLIGVIISFFLRRYRSRRRAEEFDSSQFRRSAMIMDTEGGDSSDPRPHSLFGGRWGGFAPSIRSSVVGGGMAGQGAFRSYTDQSPAQPEMQQHYAQEYEPSPTTATALQPRQQYTFGENYDNAAAQDDDLTHGAYSEQPQQQAVYNLEAYGDYDSYAPSNEAQGYTAGAHPSVPAATHQDDDPYGGI